MKRNIFPLIASCTTTENAWKRLQNIFLNDCEVVCDNLEDCMRKGEPCIVEEICNKYFMDYYETLFMEKICVDEDISYDRGMHNCNDEIFPMEEDENIFLSIDKEE